MKLFLSLAAILFSAISFAQWTKIELGTETKLNGIHFLDEELGYVVGEDGLFLKSLNSGITWKPVELSYTDVLWDIDFVNDTLGFIATNDGILRTTDGAATWIMNKENFRKAFYSICIINSTTVYASGFDGYIIKTVDSGENWEVVHDEYELFLLLLSITFTNSVEGYAAGMSSLGQGQNIVRTIDGGETWLPQKMGGGDVIQTIHFLDTQTGFAGDNKGIIYKTSDKGHSWDSIFSTDNTYGIYSIQFINSSIGYAVGGKPSTILRTSDGGNTWHKESFDDENFLTAVYFYEDKFGFALGLGGTFYKIVNNSSYTSIARELVLQQALIYPNPVSNYLHFNELEHGARFKVFDLSGEEVLNLGVAGKMLDISSLKLGVYIIQLETEGVIRTERFIKK